MTSAFSPLKNRVFGVAAGSLVLVASALGAREMSTDRPDTTESPFTVEPGRYQIESSLVGVTRDRYTPEADGTHTTTWNIAPTNFRVGLTPSAELQVVTDAYLETKTTSPDRPGGTRVRGAGDTYLRFKYNFRGNDGGDYGVGVMPFVKLPTGDRNFSNEKFEGGLILPVSLSLAQGWEMGLMTEADFVRPDPASRYKLAWLNTITVAHELTSKLGMFVELAWEVQSGENRGSFNTGFTYGVTEDLQLDAGVNLGLTRAADDLVVFTGFAIRF